MRVLEAFAVAGLVISLSACGEGDGPVDPLPRSLEIVIAGGNNQFAPASARLPDLLQVVVRSVADRRPEEGVTVSWSVVAGSGAALDQTSSVSSAAGLASVGASLGAGLGEYLIRATVSSQNDVFVEFTANAVLPPLLTVVPAAATAGDAIDIEGANFSPTPRHNTVLFSGIPGRVIASQTGRLTVEVPPCLPSRSVDVEVRLGESRSDPRSMSVTGTQMVPALTVGADTLLSGSDGFLCFAFGGDGPQASYLAVVQSSSQVGAARFDMAVLGLVGAPTAVATGSRPGAPSFGAAPAPAASAGPDGPGSAHAEWENFVRSREAEAVATTQLVQPAPAPAISTRPPVVGERRDFNVLGAGGTFTQVTGEVRLVSQRAALYVDASVLSDVPNSLLEGLAMRFDEPTFPLITESYGDVSDLDGNGQVIILLTPVVNRLTPRGADGFAAGFFFGLDLLVDAENGNQGEIFYLLVPDPTGKFSDPHSVGELERVLPAILAHELQHMIHFNERVLKRGADRTDALWLSEALAHTAEDVVAEHFAAQGDFDAARLFSAENYRRAALYLDGPSSSSLIVSTGQASLPERGAGWLFVRYLEERFGGISVLRALTQTTLTGTENVTSAVGFSWPSLLADWGAAVGVEGQPAERRTTVRSELQYPVLDLVEALRTVRITFPLLPLSRGGADFVAPDRLWSSSSAYFLIRPATTGLGLAILGSGGVPPSEEAALQLRIVRLF
ncbi:MAG: IPT/TIG domain-containing protein [Longimicrobiales bacterium]